MSRQIYNRNRNLKLEIACHCCKEEHVILVRETDYLAWKRGLYAQLAFPYLSADEREMMISHTCPKCWNEMFGDYMEEGEA